MRTSRDCVRGWEGGKGGKRVIPINVKPPGGLVVCELLVELYGALGDRFKVFVDDEEFL